MNIIEKLQAIQSELKAPKGQFNSFGKYKYRSCEDILEAVKPILAKYKCAITISDELEQFGDRYYIRAKVTFWDNESDGSISNTAYAREDETKKGMDASQITGTASSYSRKYALNGLLLIDDTKDADTDEHHALTHKEVEKPKLITEHQRVEIEQEIERTGTDAKKLMASYKVKDLDDLTETQYKNVLEILGKRADKE